MTLSCTRKIGKITLAPQPGRREVSVTWTHVLFKEMHFSSHRNFGTWILSSPQNTTNRKKITYRPYFERPLLNVGGDFNNSWESVTGFANMWKTPQRHLLPTLTCWEKSTRWRWTPEAEAAFEQVKALFGRDLWLARPYPNWPYGCKQISVPPGWGLSYISQPRKYRSRCWLT